MNSQNDDGSNAGWVVAAIIGVILLFVWISQPSGSEYSFEELEDRVSELEYELVETEDCLSDASDYISELHNTIEDSAGAIDGDYYDLYDAVARLEYSGEPYCMY